MAGVLKQKGLVRVQVYFGKEDFLSIIKDAERAGKRRVGLLPFVKKEHGFSNEEHSNSDGISKFLKFAWHYWKETEFLRLEQQAEAMRKLEEAKKVAQKAGLDI